MKIKIIKSSIPIIWLDSSIIIKIAKWKNNELNNKSDLEKIPNIYKVISKLVKNNKLICPIADQREEIYWNDKITMDVLSNLSNGIKFKFRLSIEKYQIQQFMKAFIDNTDEVTINYKDAFRSDPIKELLREKRYIVMVNLPRQYSINNLKLRKEKLRENLENIRIEVQNNKESFNSRLELEYRARLSSIVKLGSRSIENILKHKEYSIDNFNDLLALAEPLSLWNHFGGKPKGFEGLGIFYSSETLKKVPVIKIYSSVFAKILSEGSKVKGGDVMDIEQISALLPYCNYLVTDRSMKHWLRVLKFDKEYETEIFSISDYDILITKLHAI